MPLKPRGQCFTLHFTFQESMGACATKLKTSESQAPAHVEDPTTNNSTQVEQSEVQNVQAGVKVDEDAAATESKTPEQAPAVEAVEVTPEVAAETTEVKESTPAEKVEESSSAPEVKGEEEQPAVPEEKVEERKESDKEPTTSA